MISFNLLKLHIYHSLVIGPKVVWHREEEIYPLATAPDELMMYLLAHPDEAVLHFFPETGETKASSTSSSMSHPGSIGVVQKGHVQIRPKDVSYTDWTKHLFCLRSLVYEICSSVDPVYDSATGTDGNHPNKQLLGKSSAGIDRSLHTSGDIARPGPGSNLSCHTSLSPIHGTKSLFNLWLEYEQKTTTSSEGVQRKQHKHKKSKCPR